MDRPTQKELLETFKYDPETGKIWWREGFVRVGKEAFSTIGQGYLLGRYGKKLYRAHNIIWLMMYGEYPPEGKLVIDHINGRRDDNRLKNLRLVTRIENQHNRGANKASHSSTGVTGVHVRADGNFVARIRNNYKHIMLGTFPDIESAKIARAAAEKALGYSDRHGK